MKRPHLEDVKKNIPVSLAVILFAAVALLFTGIVTARYIMQEQNSGILAAQDFYFTSNFLKADPDAAYYIDPQSGGFKVELYNYEDSKRITPENITYNVTVTNGTSDQASGTFSANAAEKATLTITPVSGAKKVTVTVTSTAPYQKTLTAVFHLTAGNTYSVTDATGNTAAALDMIYTGGESNSISLTLPSGIIPDATDDRITQKDSVANTYTYTFPKAGVYSLVLLKSDASVSFSGSGTFTDSIALSNN